jgi:hypothetical protein
MEASQVNKEVETKVTAWQMAEVAKITTVSRGRRWSSTGGRQSRCRRHPHGSRRPR